MDEKELKMLIQRFECKECENWMEDDGMNFDPFYVDYKCSCCDREVRIFGKMKIIKI